MTTKKFGLRLATALVVGNIVGSAIFMMPASLAPLGLNALTGWAITAVGALSLAWVFAQLGKYRPDAGGSFGIMRDGLGEGAAFLGSWGYIASCWAGNGAIAMAGANYLSRLFPPIGASNTTIGVTALVALWAFTLVNLRGRGAAGGVQFVSSVIKLLPFIAVIGLGFAHLIGSGAGAIPSATGGSITFAATSSAVGLTLYTMLGLESAAVPSDVVENPRRNVPLATMIGTGLSAFVTIASTTAVALMLPVDQVAASKAPVADFVAASWGSIAGGLVAICAVVSAFGCLNGWLFMTGELPAAMATEGALPRWFGMRNAAGAPARAIVLGSVVTTLLLGMASTKNGIAAYNFAALLATATNLVTYLFCVMAAAKFVRNGVLPRSAGLVICILLSLAFVVWAFYGSGSEALKWGAVLMAAGWPLYLVAKRVAMQVALARAG